MFGRRYPLLQDGDSQNRLHHALGSLLLNTNGQGASSQSRSNDVTLGTDVLDVILSNSLDPLSSANQSSASRVANGPRGEGTEFSPYDILDSTTLLRRGHQDQHSVLHPAQRYHIGQNAMENSGGREGDNSRASLEAALLSLQQHSSIGINDIATLLQLQENTHGLRAGPTSTLNTHRLGAVDRETVRELQELETGSMSHLASVFVATARRRQSQEHSLLASALRMAVFQGSGGLQAGHEGGEEDISQSGLLEHCALTSESASEPVDLVQNNTTASLAPETAVQTTDTAFSDLISVPEAASGEASLPEAARGEAITSASLKEDGEDVEYWPGEPFPFKLHRMVCTSEKEGNGHIISFAKEGNVMKIGDMFEFKSKILPRAFPGVKMESFRRQLNSYGFRKDRYGPQKGVYRHKYFHRDKRSLCKFIKRVPAKNRRKIAKNQI